MNLKKDKINELVQKHFNGNKTKFARELGVDPSHLLKFLNTGIGGGKKIVAAIYRYCVKKGIEFDQYIDI